MFFSNRSITAHISRNASAIALDRTPLSTTEKKVCAIHVRDHDVEQDEIGHCSLDAVQCLFAALSRLHLVSFGPRQRFKKPDVPDFVVNDKNASGRIHHEGTWSAASATCVAERAA